MRANGDVGSERRRKTAAKLATVADRELIVVDETGVTDIGAGGVRAFKVAGAGIGRSHRRPDECPPSVGTSGQDQRGR